MLYKTNDKVEIVGDGYLGANDGATCAQAAQMLKNFMEKAAK